MNNQSFTHRPPSTGIHLLSDPLPKRSADLEDKNLVSAKRPPAKNKKSGTRT